MNQLMRNSIRAVLIFAELIFEDFQNPQKLKLQNFSKSTDRKVQCRPNGLEKEKEEGNADEIYYIVSEVEGDHYQDGNAFEIFDDENSEDYMQLFEETLLCAFMCRQ